MITIKFIDKVFLLLGFSLAVFGFMYHFTESWVPAMIVASNLFFAITILVGIRHERELKDFEKSVGRRIRRRKQNRKGRHYAGTIQN